MVYYGQIPAVIKGATSAEDRAFPPGWPPGSSPPRRLVAAAGRVENAPAATTADDAPETPQTRRARAHKHSSEDLSRASPCKRCIRNPRARARADVFLAGIERRRQRVKSGGGAEGAPPSSSAPPRRAVAGRARRGVVPPPLACHTSLPPSPLSLLSPRCLKPANRRLSRASTSMGGEERGRRGGTRPQRARAAQGRRQRAERPGRWFWARCGNIGDGTRGPNERAAPAGHPTGPAGAHRDLALDAKGAVAGGEREAADDGGPPSERALRRHRRITQSFALLLLPPSLSHTLTQRLRTVRWSGFVCGRRRSSLL
jgi:hypothetical protein